MEQKQDNYYLSLALYFYLLLKPGSFLALMQPNEKQRRHIMCEIDALSVFYYSSLARMMGNVV